MVTAYLHFFCSQQRFYCHTLRSMSEPHSRILAYYSFKCIPSNFPCSPEKLLGSRGYLTIWQGDHQTQYPVLITAVDYLALCKSWQLTLHSPLYLLKQKYSNLFFRHCKIKTIVKQILAKLNSPEITLQWHCQQNLPIQSVVIQDDRTDFDFLQQLLRQTNLQMVFLPKHTFAISDNTGKIPHLPHHSLWYHQQPHLLSYEQLRLTDVHWQHQYLSPKSSRLVLQGKSLCSYILSGQKIRLQGHPLDALNQDYICTAVAHSLGHSAPKAYWNQLRLLPLHHFHKPSAPQAYHQGLQLACVINPQPQSSYPALSKDGEYMLRYLQDKQQQTMLPIPQGQELVGKHSGWHFPLRHNQHTVVGFIQGHAPDGVILGAIHNQVNQSNVKCNTDNKQLTSAGGNTLTMHERKGEEYLSITNSSQTQGLFFHNNLRNHDINLRNAQGNIKLHSGEFKTVHCASHVKIRAHKDLCYTTKYALKFTYKGNCTVHSQGSQKIFAKQRILFKSLCHTIQCYSRKKISFYGNKNLHYQVCQGDLKLNSKGQSTLLGKNRLTLQSHSNIIMKHHAAQVRITNHGEIFIQGSCIKIQVRSS